MAHEKMLDAHPRGVGGIDRDELAECIAACFEYVQVCTACADAGLGERPAVGARTRAAPSSLPTDRRLRAIRGREGKIRMPTHEPENRQEHAVGA